MKPELIERGQYKKIVASRATDFNQRHITPKLWCLCPDPTTVLPLPIQALDLHTLSGHVAEMKHKMPNVVL